MSKIEDGGPAFPAGAVRKSRPAHDPGADFRVTDITDPKNGGMTLRQYAAIKLRVPNSGTDWLDEMILKSLRDELAAMAVQGIYASDTEAWHCSGTPEGLASRAKDTYAIADAMLAARGE